MVLLIPNFLNRLFLWVSTVRWEMPSSAAISLFNFPLAQSSAISCSLLVSLISGISSISEVIDMISLLTSFGILVLASASNLSLSRLDFIRSAFFCLILLIATPL